ncbi:agmatine deiminase family protein [Myxococcota bacterium]|jgi:agmatine/peptidylarginine deiminase|nr:agmatine deiminase family protein [Myxococcota bacterium]
MKGLLLGGLLGFQVLTSAAVGPALAILPAWPSAVRQESRFLQSPASDPRADHPEYYAVTVPPEGAFRLPGEWEPVRSVLLDLPDDLGASIHGILAGMIREGIREAEWHVLVPGASIRRVMEDNLLAAGLSPSDLEERVRFLPFATESLWTMDFGPVPLLDDRGRLAFADFRYFRDRPRDDAVPSWLGRLLGVTTYRPPLDLEGGNLQGDGEGTCYTTRRLFQGNPDRTEEEIRGMLREYLGCDRLVVLFPLADGTHHLDMLGRLAGPRTFLLGQGSPDRNTEETVGNLEANAAILEEVVRRDGTRLEVIRIPMPYQLDGVWRTYTNAAMVNGVVLVPVYEADRGLETEALAAWSRAVPGARVVPVESEGIIGWGGALHCIARTIPMGTLAKRVQDGQCLEGTCLAPEGAFQGECLDSSDCQGPAWVCDRPDCDAGGGPGDPPSEHGLPDAIAAGDPGTGENLPDPGIEGGDGGPEEPVPGGADEGMSEGVPGTGGRGTRSGGCSVSAPGDGFRPGKGHARIVVFALGWMVYTTARNRSSRGTVFRAEGRSGR